MSNSRRASSVGVDLAMTMPVDQRPWYKVPHLVKLNLIILSLLMYSGTAGYDGSMMNGLQALTQWQVWMGHPKGYWLGFINVIQLVGGLVTFPVQAYLADRFGRRISLWAGLATVLLGATMQAAAQTHAQFILARFFVGMAGSLFVPAVVLITEIAYPSHRSKVTALYNTQFYVGSLIAAWATFGVRNYTDSWAWRVPSLLQLAIPALALFGTIFCPESPRWLVAHGRIEDARNVLVQFHAGGDVNSPMVEFEMTEIQRAISLEKQAKASASYLDMLRTKGNRHRLFISVTLGIFAQWAGNGVVSYYLSLILTTVGITSVTQQTLLNGFLNLFNLMMAVGAAMLVDRVGRKKLFITSVSTMLVAYIVITALSATFANTGAKAVGTAVIPMLFIFFAGYDIAFTPLVVAYPAEIWPFALRARGVTVTLLSTYMALFFNIFVNPIALSSLAWKYYIVFVCVLAIALVTIWFGYPETRGHTLEEMATLFDGDDAAIASSSEVREAVEYSETKRNASISHIEETSSIDG